MYAYVKGVLVESTPTHAILDVHGIGYRVHIPLNNFSKLPPIGQPITLYTSTVIREDAHKLYGFLTLHERVLFEHLIEISGIGPKMALALLGHTELADLQLAISRGDTTLLSKIPGVGKKTAERLIVEMRDKIMKIAGDASHLSQADSPALSDALAALINLGYSAAQAQKALKATLAKLGKEPDLATLITHALRSI